MTPHTPKKGKLKITMSLIAFKAIHADTTDVTVDSFVPAGTAKIVTKGCEVEGAKGVVINPSFEGKNIDVDVQIKHPSLKDTVTSLKYTSKAGIFPSFTHNYLGGKEHTFTLGLRNGSPLGYTWKHPEGVFNAAVSAKLSDWLSSSASLTCRVTADVIAGVSVEYDPLRSGLKSYSVGIKHAKVGALTVDATRAFTLSSSRKVNAYVDVFGLVSSNRAGNYSAVAAAKFSSPCGANAFAKIDAINGDTSVSFSKIREGNWLPRVSAHGNLFKGKFIGLGVSFTREDI